MSQLAAVRRSACRVRARGLTLLELVVVLVVLIVLGMLVVQNLSGMLTRSHLSKCADTITSLNKIWGQSYAAKVRYPDNYDSLLASGGTTMYSPITPGLAAQTSLYTLTDADVAALRTVGVTRVTDLAAVTPGTGDVTYQSDLVGIAPRVLATGGRVAQLNHTAHFSAGNELNLKRHLVRQSDGSTFDNSANVTYLIFGVGPNCTGIGSGRLIQEAPVHFGADDTINPKNVYQRYLIVFSLVTNADGTRTAYYEAAAGNDTAGPSGAESHVREFHDAAASDT